MKKLMIALGVIAMAVAANAASIKWNSGTIYVATDDKGTTGSTMSAKANTNTRLVKMYVYELADSTEFAAAQKMDTKTLYDTYNGSSKIVGSVGSNGGGITAYNQTVGDASGYHYAVAIFVDEGSATKAKQGETFIKAGVYSANVGSAADIPVGNMITSVQSSTWTAAVPEPTSGLLLLLGVAGLALRRKQK